MYTDVRLLSYGYASDTEIVFNKEKNSIFSMTIVARKINIKGFGRTKIYAFLKDLGHIDERNLALAKYVGEGYYINQLTNKNCGGKLKSFNQVLVTMKGLEHIKRLLKQEVK
jgi:hypothetical protein